MSGYISCKIFVIDRKIIGNREIKDFLLLHCTDNTTLEQIKSITSSFNPIEVQQNMDDEHFFLVYLERTGQRDRIRKELISKGIKVNRYLRYENTYVNELFATFGGITTTREHTREMSSKGKRKRE